MSSNNLSVKSKNKVHHNPNSNLGKLILIRNLIKNKDYKNSKKILKEIKFSPALHLFFKYQIDILQKCKNGKLKYRTKRIKEEEEVVYDFADNIISTILSEVTYPEITEEDKLLVLHYYVYTINKEIGRYYIKPISMKRHRQLIY